MKKALITGMFGQDGSYLCELLDSRKYEIHGIVRSQLSATSEKNKDALKKKGINFTEHIVDLCDYEQLKELLLRIRPDEIYHMAAYHVSSEGVKSRQQYYDTILFQHNVNATANILSICSEFLGSTKVFTAGSCLMYDASETVIQDEDTPFQSRSMYGLAKTTENMLVSYYRDQGLFACMGILYNHESARRPPNYVTKKIVENMLLIKSGQKDSFSLANLDTEKDWGFAGDYAYGMYLMLQADKPSDYILATGEMHTIRELLEICAEFLELPDWEDHIEIDPAIVNRKVSGRLCGNSEKIRRELGWFNGTGFRDMVIKMLEECRE